MIATAMITKRGRWLGLMGRVDGRWIDWGAEGF